MRIYANCLEAVKEIERDLFEMGIQVQPDTMQDKIVKDDPNFLTLELSPYGFTIVAGGQKDKEEFLKYLNVPQDWADAEFEERISKKSCNPGKAWELRRYLWEEFIHDNKFSYTYAKRFKNQLDVIINELKIHPNTRQAIIQIYSYLLDINSLGGKKRIPCSLNVQFLIREGKLKMIYTMRSNDFLTFFASDNYLAMRLQEYIAEQLKIEVGSYTFFTGSLHCYKKDMKKDIF